MGRVGGAVDSRPDKKLLCFSFMQEKVIWTRVVTVGMKKHEQIRLMVGV